MAKPLTATEVTFGDVTFRIGKLLPLEAKRVFMGHVRPLLRGALNAEVGEEKTTDPETGEGVNANQWKILLAAFTDAPQTHYDAISQALYQRIQFRRAGDDKFRPLGSDEEYAFQGLDMAHLLMLDARAFAVNFFGSFGVLLSEFQSLAPTLQSLMGRTHRTSSGSQSPAESSD